ncbi:MAG: hypothetical protein Q9220_002006 [cf. Caloplaca sp. 1 TL-2023]
MSAAPVPSEQVKPGGSNTSSPGLSSPPSPRSPSVHSSVAYPQLPTQIQHGARDEIVGVGGNKPILPANNNVAPKQRKPRRKKDSVEGSSDGKLSTIPNGQKAPAKPRKPRVPKATPTSLSSTMVKKEQKLPFAPDVHPAKLPASSPSILADHQRPLPKSSVAVIPPQSPKWKSDEAIPTSRNPTHYVMPSPPRPTSGQNYDPIRSATIEPRPVHQQQQQSPLSSAHARTSASTPPRPASHASFSPSIASLLEPHSTAPSHPVIPKRENEPHATSPPEPKRPRLTPPANIVETAQSVPKTHESATPQPPSTNGNAPFAMDLDASHANSKPASKPLAGTKKPSGHSSSSHSPKPSGRKESAIPPLPPGNGLLSSAMLGGGNDSQGSSRSAPTVVLHVPLNGDSNKYVNFARLAEEQYGFDALHPRLAAQRERLARVAAAGAAIENAHKTGSGRSADEMSVDLSEGEPDADNSNVEMGGVNGNKDPKQSEAEGSEANGPKKRRKRTMKEDMYDKEDPFVDDSELAFEEQAAATKDGFFVYSGPLVPEGEKANVERYVVLSAIDAVTADMSLSRAEGAPKRGRGRGRGARGGASGGTTRGGGGGSAAPATPGPSTTLTKSGQPRKQRVTKAAKAIMEAEKVQRESMAPLAAKPTSYPGPAATQT